MSFGSLTDRAGLLALSVEIFDEVLQEVGAFLHLDLVDLQQILKPERKT